MQLSSFRLPKPRISEFNPLSERYLEDFFGRQTVERFLNAQARG